MEVIDARELKSRLDRGEKLTLVMFMDRASYDKMHIPGSVHCADLAEALRRFDKHETLVGYCSTDACVYSKRICTQLVDNGYSKITHFTGGLWAWEQAGYSVEGTMVGK
jgi:rhodanese-related sulfurtransferase